MIFLECAENSLSEKASGTSGENEKEDKKVERSRLGFWHQ